MPGNDDPMPKPEREREILRFLAEREVMLPPRALYDNLLEYENIHFSYSTTQRLLHQLKDRELVRRLDKGHGYYQITDAGREYLDADNTD
jgi:DNA-binding PadR family transcriptional regulator